VCILGSFFGFGDIFLKANLCLLASLRFAEPLQKA
jgi:hypothetical protein